MDDGRWIKISLVEEYVLGRVYYLKILGGRFHLAFRSDSDETSGEHTHVFLEKDVNKGIGIDIDEAFKILYIFREEESPPKGVTDVVLQLGFSYESREDWDRVFIEFLVSRKLTQDLVNELTAWVEIMLKDLDEIILIDEKGEAIDS